MGMRAFQVFILIIALGGLIGSLFRAAEAIANAAVRGEKAEYTAELVTAVFSTLVCIFMISNIWPI